MSFNRVRSFLHWNMPTKEERAVLKVQFGVFLAASVLLSIGYYEQRELRIVADREHLRFLLRGWDGFAWLVWLLAAPAMLVLIRRFPIQRGMIGRSVLGLALGSVILYAIVANLRYGLRILPNLWLDDANDLPNDWSHYVVSILYLLPMDFMTYCGFFSASFAIDSYFKQRRRAEETLQLQLRTAQLESDLARTELSSLRGQLHPHFLFNSFNAVASLVRQKKNEPAVEMIAQLSGLLRLAIERTGRQQLPFSEEMEFVRRYLEVERVRFGEKLQLEFDLDPETLRAMLPNLLLQPLVENAIKHGISLRTTPGRIRISSAKIDSRLQIQIADDGPEAEPVGGETLETRKKGIGLSNTRMRLEKIYGENFELDLLRRPDGGMTVTIELPFEPARLTESAG